ncbi:SPOR domain-containing protein [Novosphingobium umbonatum]|uniref:SPOR domain-containing protein n=1 Tax=Novosphingobium umbonatum TaxID=1908524 RepID=UPI0013E3ECA1|nr:SPOR domain-containing protein [Novosphingobium umbonatum]
MVGAFSAFTIPAQADVKTGVDAWSRGDYATALREWQPYADKGDADALFNLGQAYKLGRGVPQDMVKAEMLYAKAAAKGHAQAGDNYGLLLYQRGEKTAALPYLRAGADRGNSSALYLMGLSYFNADGVSKDWVRAYALESLAAQPHADVPALGVAQQALTQMDQYIPMEDRQRGIALASELATQIEANRNRLATATALGTPVAMAPAVKAPTPAARPAARMAPPEAVNQPAPEAVQLATPTKAEPAPKPAPVKAETKAPVLAKVEAKVPVKAEAPEAPRAPAEKPVAPKPVAKPAPALAAGSWKLQLGAFGVAANADALWGKVKALPQVAGHARQNVPSGKVNRLLAAGYSEDAAHSACSQLSAKGISCLAVKE